MNSQYQPTTNLKEMLGYFEEQVKKAVERAAERKKLKLYGMVAAACVLLYVLIQNVLSFPLMLEPLRSLYLGSMEFQKVVDIVFSIIGLLVPFALGGIILHKKKVLPSLALGRPNSFPLMFSSVPFGFFICLVANYITSLLVAFTQTSGVELSSPDFSAPQTLLGRILYVVSVAIVPPLVEEFAVRGVVMQPLRRYGDRFAIFVSAFIFGIMHGNLIQAPFAFISGLGMGYAVCLTNSIWTGVLIHFCNNFYSVMVDIMISEIPDEALVNKIFLILQVVLFALSIAGSVVFAFVRRKRRIEPAQIQFRLGSKIKAYFLNVPMIIAVLVMLSIIIQYVNPIE